MKRYTVVWTHAARERLAELWLENPAIKQEIADASDQIERGLAQRPTNLGILVSPLARLVAIPPLTILYRVVEADRQVRVIHVKLWDE